MGSSKYRNNLWNKTKENKLVDSLFKKHYSYLSERCVDYDVFIDTYMKMTYCYDEKIDFVNEFIRIYKSLKYRYIRLDNEVKKISIDKLYNI